MIKHLLSKNYLSLHINMIVQIIYKFIFSLFQFTFSSKTPNFFLSNFTWFLFIIFMCMGVLPMGRSAHNSIAGAWGSQKKVSEPLGLE